MNSREEFLQKPREKLRNPKMNYGRYLRNNSQKPRKEQQKTPEGTLRVNPGKPLNEILKGTPAKYKKKS